MLLHNKGTLKRIIIIIPILYIMIWIVLICLNYKAYGFIFSMFDTKLDKIHTHIQVTTGLMHYINNVKGINLIEKDYPGLSTYEIELVGDTPYGYVKDPVAIGDLVVYGNFKGSTDRYRNIGYDDVPVFEVKYYNYPSIHLGSDLYTLPIHIAVLLLPLFLAFEILIIRNIKD